MHTPMHPRARANTHTRNIITDDAVLYCNPCRTRTRTRSRTRNNRPTTTTKVSKQRGASSYSAELAQSYAPSGSYDAAGSAGNAYASSSYAPPQQPSGPMSSVMQPRKIPIPGVGSFETSLFNLAVVFGVFGWVAHAKGRGGGSCSAWLDLNLELTPLPARPSPVLPVRSYTSASRRARGWHGV